MRICKNTTTVTQLLQKKFHFCWTREEKAYDQKHLRRAMWAPSLRDPELGSITVFTLLSQD